MSLFLTNSGASLVLATGGIPVTQTSPLLAGVHPRLGFVTSGSYPDTQTITDIRTKLSTHYGASSGYDDIEGTFQAFVTALDALYGTGSTTTDALWYASSFAFLYNVDPVNHGWTAAHTAAEYGAEAARLLQISITANAISLGDGQLGSGVEYAYAYDMAYHALSSTQREAMCDQFAAGNPVSFGSSVWAADAGKWMPGYLVGASAVAGDGYQDAWAESWLSLFDTPSVTWPYYPIVGATGRIGAQSYIARMNGGTLGAGGTSGLQYTGYEWPWWVLHMEAHRTATGVSKASYYDESFDIVRSGLHYYVHNLRPYALTNGGWPDGTSWAMVRTQYTSPSQSNANHHFMVPLMFAGIYKDVDLTSAKLATWYGRHRCFQDGVDSYRLGRTWLFRFLYEDPTIADETPETLGIPTAAWCGDGLFHHRSGWQTPATDWYARFCAAKYLILGDGRGTHHMNGHYELHCKGPGTMIRGSSSHAWQGHGAFNTVYFLDHTRFSSPWVLADYESKLLGRVNAGSAPSAPMDGEQLIDGENWDFLGDVRYRHGALSNAIDYESADLSAWHPGPQWTNANNPASVVLWVRHFLLFRPSSAGYPLRAVICDDWEVESTNITPTLSWNPAGAAITVDGSETNPQHGVWSYNSASKATVVHNNTSVTPNYSQLHTLTVVLPTSRTLVKAGGPNESAQSYHDDTDDGGWSYVSANYSCEGMDLYNQRWVHDVTNGSDPEQNAHYGTYHVRVTAASAATTGAFLCVDEIIPDHTATASVVEPLTSLTNCRGCAMRHATGNDLAVFGTQGDVATGAFTVPTAGTYRTMIANLSANPTITPSNGTVANQSYDSASHTVVCTLTTNAVNVSVTLS